MGNVSKRQQPDQKAENGRRSQWVSNTARKSRNRRRASTGPFTKM